MQAILEKFIVAGLIAAAALLLMTAENFGS